MVILIRLRHNTVTSQQFMDLNGLKQRWSGKVLNAVGWVLIFGIPIATVVAFCLLIYWLVRQIMR